MSPWGRALRTVTVLAGCEISIAVLGRAAAFDAPSGLLCNVLLGSTEHIWHTRQSASSTAEGAATDAADARRRNGSSDGVMRRVCGLRAHGGWKSWSRTCRTQGLGIDGARRVHDEPVANSSVGHGLDGILVHRIHPGVGRWSSRLYHDQANGARDAQSTSGSRGCCGSRRGAVRAVEGMRPLRRVVVCSAR